ncbi:GNAT family N-acetyltransferase [Bacillus sp. JJ722]|uniref:GNAT family N-acetyltransferase n=1 Tax=Bacillus sp. JJ722 TaxID=3122973 RepID=UPI002FFFB0F3
MKNIEIRRPRMEDREELIQFFSEVIEHTYAKEGLSEMLDDMKNEIETKKQYLQSDLESNCEKRYFLLALHKIDNKIIGCIEYGSVSELIGICTDGALKELVEVGTVFVHPNYQKQGIGTLLLNVMFLILQNRGIKEFYLDSGYKNAQKIWQKKFGKPDYLLKNYWGEGSDHMIWKLNTNDQSVVFSI